MTLPVAALAILAGLVLLAFGGEGLVRGATTLARLVGLTPAVIGLTVVALGTSFPELVVSVYAALEGRPDIALGNVVGSNLINVVGILGVTALVSPLMVRGNVVRIEWPFLAVITAMVLLLMRDRLVDRVEGSVMLVLLVLFMAFSVFLARRELAPDEAAQFEAQVTGLTLPSQGQAISVSLVIVLGALVGLYIGGRLLVEGAVVVARTVGMTERVIALTIVAGGTSAPELAASVIAARRGQADVAIGNLIGSNIFNLLGILGVTAVMTPVPVLEEIARHDAWWMMGTTLLLFPLLRTGFCVTRREGALLVTIYGVYLGLLLRG